jgi:two-component system cell cycle response regulator
MMENDERTSVDRILGLASKWQIAEAIALVNELSAPSESENFIACRALLNGISGMREGNYEVGIQEALSALTHLERHGLRSFLGYGFGMLGSPETGLELVSKAIAGAERQSDEAQLRRSFSDEGRLLAMLDGPEKSVASFDKTLALKDSASSFEKVDIFNNIAHTYLDFARREEQDASQRIDLARKAMDLARSALSILEGEPNDRFQALSLENLGNALSILGNFAEAEAAFTKALPLSESHAHINVELLTSYAWLLCEMRRYEESDLLLSRAYTRAQADKQKASMDRLLESRIRLGMLAGKTDEALLWSERRFRFMESQYRQHLTSVARNAEIFVELEQARLAEREARQRHDELTAINKTLEPVTHVGKDETLRDVLTGCLNQRGLTLSSESFFTPGKYMALAMTDIDHFKPINDRFGPEAGNEVLQSIAQIFNKSLRDSDLVARLDGEEFLLLINGVETDAAWGTCERLRLAVERYGWGTIAAGLRVTISIGLAVRMNDEEIDLLTSKADSALHQAKTAGRNRVISG